MRLKFYIFSIRYMYTGEFSLQEHSDDLILDLTIAADKLNLTDMVNYIRNNFIKQETSLIEQNIIRVYNAPLQLEEYYAIPPDESDEFSLKLAKGNNKDNVIELRPQNQKSNSRYSV